MRYGLGLTFYLLSFDHMTQAITDHMTQARIFSHPIESLIPSRPLHPTNDVDRWNLDFVFP